MKNEQGYDMTLVIFLSICFGMAFMEYGLPRMLSITWYVTWRVFLLGIAYLLVLYFSDLIKYKNK